MARVNVGGGLEQAQINVIAKVPELRSFMKRKYLFLTPMGQSVIKTKALSSFSTNE